MFFQISTRPEHNITRKEVNLRSNVKHRENAPTKERRFAQTIARYGF
jgi:hypothetical protein